MPQTRPMIKGAGAEGKILNRQRRTPAAIDLVLSRPEGASKDVPAGEAWP